jgi:lipoprotein-anchoring transpeptidase ErfK/SrfK
LDKIKTLNTDLTLEEDSYQKAALQASDPALADQANALNHFYDSSVTYDIGDQKVHLTADTYRSWMLPQEDGSFTYDETQLTDYVKKLKSATDTIYTVRPFTTVSGETRSVSGTYGFNLSVKQETAQLASDLLSSQNVEREPLYQSSGAMRAVRDYGNTYLEVDMTNQKVYLWEDGKISFTTDCVTGNTSRQRGTPTGIYAIMYKAKDVVLRGDNYASPVTYWMPFYKGCGFHDASWRGKFGGTIYRYNGSHGCVNLPIPSAKTLYEKVYAGMPVILYY